LQPRPASEYDEHVAEVRDKAQPGFTAIAVPPFVVLGDGRPEDVRADAESIVGWGVKRLKADFFARDPARIIDIWMFNGEESYLRNNSAIFGKTPISPYGYYSPCNRALIINIGLGGGTLIHEMVHAFIEANFPDCPTWFNEGLASLYEQPDDRDGHIHGRTNWRLARLQASIEIGKAPSLHAVMSSSRGEFYDDRRSPANYAAARYLLYYVQEAGLLVRYYKSFLANRERDPTGEATLLQVLGVRELGALQRKWEGYVRTLVFP
jgi:hypothetical protein